MDYQLSLFQAYQPAADLVSSSLQFDFDLENIYQPPSPPAKRVNPFLVTMQAGYKSHADVIGKWEKLPPEIRSGKLRLTFDEPIALQANRKKLTAKKPVHEFRLFSARNDGLLCYTNTTRTGFPFSLDDLGHLVSIEPVPAVVMVEKVRKLANRFYPEVWDDLKANLITDPQKYFNNYGYSVTSITGKFPEYVLSEIKWAFQHKSKYTYETGGNWGKKTGRDLKVECHVCEDGIYRAWFSSEFPGCANGDYWILCNPTTAIFRERD